VSYNNHEFITYANGNSICRYYLSIFGSNLKAIMIVSHFSEAISLTAGVSLDLFRSTEIHVITATKEQSGK
jgi:hypothetical protein